MQKMEILIYKNQEIVKFPYQKFEMSFGTLDSKRKNHKNYITI